MAVKKNELSPAMRQYVDMKAECDDALLLFRLGDFYEAFFDDAVTISRALDLVLTRRGTTVDGTEIPMCGIPWHAAENYIARLVRSGFSVAIAEQMETPDEAKARGRKQIERKIVRVLTPGTLTDENLLAPRQANFLVAIAPRIEKRETRNRVRGDDLGHVSRIECFEIAGCDISTGEFFIGELSDDLFDELARLNPAETIYPESAAEFSAIKRIRGAFKTTPVYDRIFQRENIADIVQNIFGIESARISIAIHLLAGYLDQTQRGANLVFRAPYRLGTGVRLLLDAATWRSLEIDTAMQAGGSTLLDVIDKTRTSAGARKIRAYLRELSGDADEIRRRQEHIRHLLQNSEVATALRATLARVPDTGRALSRLASNRGNPRDLRAIADFTSALPGIKNIGEKLDARLAAQFGTIDTNVALAAEMRAALADDLPSFFRDGNIIRAGYDPYLDNMNHLAHGAREVIAGLQVQYVQMTGISTLKIRYNNILGYHIEVPAKQADKLFVPESGFIHRQTMTGNVRFTTARLIELDNEVRGAAGKAVGIEQEIITRLIETINAAAPSLFFAADLLAESDVWSALAECAEEYGWVQPTITETAAFDIRGGRHPVVEKILRSRAEHFVKNDCEIGTEDHGLGVCDSVTAENQTAPRKIADESRTPGSESRKAIALLTGPNMAGKSTYLRQNALIIILSHMGSFVPADSARIGICDQLFSRVGASDNLAAGQSTFMVEMTETANILNRATNKSFIIFDEIGRGTATFDGLSLAWAVLEFLDALAPRCLFATHYHELTALANYPSAQDKAKGVCVAPLQNLKCLTVEVKEYNNEIIFMHKIVPGVAASSYGIHVAKMAGMPAGVVARAEAVLAGLESKSSTHPCTDKVPGSLALQVPRDDTEKQGYSAPNATPTTHSKVSRPRPAQNSQLSLFGD